MNSKSPSITHCLIHYFKSFRLFSQATKEGTNSIIGTHARTENHHTLVIWMCSLGCRRRLAEGHSSQVSAMSSKFASLTWSYDTCTNAHMLLFLLAHVCCVPLHTSHAVGCRQKLLKHWFHAALQTKANPQKLPYIYTYICCKKGVLNPYG